MTGDRQLHDYFRTLAAGGIDGELTPSQTLELRAHLAACEVCRADERAMRRDNDWLRSMDAARPVSPTLRAAVLEVAGRGRTPPRGLAGLRWAAVGAAIVVVALGAAQLVLRPNPTAPGAVGSPTPSGSPSATSPASCRAAPFGTPGRFPTTSAGSQPWALAALDATGDRVLDLVVTLSDPGAVGVLVGVGDSRFSQPRPYPVGVPMPLPTDEAAPSPQMKLGVGDMDGDGSEDLVVGRPFSGGLSVLLNDGRGGFHVSATRTIERPASPVVADLDGDAAPDIAVANGDDVAVFWGDGTGQIIDGPRIAVATTAFGIAAADLDGDGEVDLVVSHSDAHGLSVIHGAGGRDLEPAFKLEALAGEGVTLADVNGDGRLDATVANSGPGSVSVLLGDGSGSFGPASVLMTDPQLGPGSALVFDVDGDGHVDIVSNAGAGDRIVVLFGNGTGSFDRVEKIASPGGPTGLASGDFDGDGLTDIATANANDDSVSVRLGACGS